MEENLTLNYLALLACIISKATVEKSVEIITCQKIDTRNRIFETNSNPVIITDTWTNTELEFRSQGDAGRHLGMNRNTPGRYVDTGRIYKKRYYFRSKNKSI